MMVAALCLAVVAVVRALRTADQWFDIFEDISQP